MNRPKQTVQKKVSSGSSVSSGFWDLLGLDALLSEFPLVMIILVLLGGFFLLYWLGKQVWKHAPEWIAALANPTVQRNVLLFVGAVIGVSLFALDRSSAHTLLLDSARVALCIAGVGAALLFRRSLCGTV